MTELEMLRAKIDDIDAEMAKLFAARMEICRSVAEYKHINSLPVRDASREDEVIRRNSETVPADMAELYRSFLENVMALSREYQESLAEGGKLQ